MLKHLKRRNVILIIVVIFALLVRIVSFSYWKESPLSEYSKIQGLDMKTHIEFAQDFLNGKSAFSLYKLLCGSMIWLNNANPISGIVLFQHLSGAISSVLVSLISLKLTANKNLALFAGLLYALYAPLIMYESFTLVETIFVTSCLIAIYVVVSVNFRKKYSLFISGLLVVLPSLSRFSGIFLSVLLFLWFIVRLGYRRESENNITFFKVILIFLLGTLVSLCTVILINFLNTGEFMILPGRPVLSYILRAGSEMKINPDEELLLYNPGDFMIQRRISSYFEKIYKLISPYEIPNNINYYFLRTQFFPLKFLLGPLFLIPLGVSGFLISLADPRKLKRYSILFFYFIAIALPMIVFIPLARYRIALLLFFVFFSAYYLNSLIRYLRISQKKPLPLLLILLVYTVVLSSTAPKDFPLRSEDFVGYGRALEYKNPESEEVLYAYVKGYEFAPYSHSAVVHLSNYLMTRNRFSDARVILDDYNKKCNDSVTKILFAASLLGCGQFVEAKEVLEKMHEPENVSTKVNYFYQFAECHRLLGNELEAKKYYDLAFKYSQDELQKRIISESLNRLMKGSPKK